MIELTAANALLIYLGVTVATVMAVWILSHYKSRKRSFTPLEKELNQCEFCHFAYIDEGAKQVTRCPRCNSFNRKR